MRFPKTHKLTTKVDYKITLDQPYKISHKHLLIFFKKSELDCARLGLIVGKRVAALAVDRNKIKRVIRESFRVKQKELQGLDIVVLARHQCDTLSKEELRKGIDKLWEKVITQYRNLLSS